MTTKLIDYDQIVADVVSLLKTMTGATQPYKLVGLVSRQGRLLAAFSVAGDVVLAGPGETVAGATVVEVGEEAVRIRRADGSETLLPLP